MNARLVAEEGMLKGLVLPLEGGEEWVIGRDPDACQLLLEDPAASRKHLLCKSTSEGFSIENLSPTNPVQINDEDLEGTHLLKEGDTVGVGSGMFRFILEAPEEKPPEEEAPSESAEEAPDRHDSILEEHDENNEKHRLAEINFEIEETGRWLLKVIGGPNNGAEFSMQADSTYLVGTDPNTCDIIFHDTSVSRQHARITIDPKDNIFIEDLKSRNGVLVDGETLKEKTEIKPNIIVSLGTSSFVIYDREGSMQTIISPLMPSLVKVLQKEEGEKEKTAEKEVEEKPAEPPAPLPPKEKPIGNLILIAIITGLFVLTAIGTTALFKGEQVIVKEVKNLDQMLVSAFEKHPSINYSYNKSTGNIVLFGHLLTTEDKTQLLHSLYELPFVKGIDDVGIVLDESVWREMNQVLHKNPEWHSISIQSPSAGQFILTGTLQTRKQAKDLYEYITINFPYLEHLEKQIIIEEEIKNDVKSSLERVGILNTQVSFRDGEVIITGGVPTTKQEAFNQIVEEIKQTPGIRDVRVRTTSLARSQSMLNISDRYEVTGFSRIRNNISVVINGRIVTEGDVLDGMVIKEITSGSILLEKDNISYRIDFSK